MSQEKVEIVHAFAAAINRGDFERAFKYAAPGAEIDLSRAVGLDRTGAAPIGTIDRLPAGWLQPVAYSDSPAASTKRRQAHGSVFQDPARNYAVAPR